MGRISFVKLVKFVTLDIKVTIVMLFPLDKLVLVTYMTWIRMVIIVRLDILVKFGRQG